MGAAMVSPFGTELGSANEAAAGGYQASATGNARYGQRAAQLGVRAEATRGDDAEGRVLDAAAAQAKVSKLPQLNSGACHN